MQRNVLMRLMAVSALVLALSACSTSKNQNPVASGEEVGKVADESTEKPSEYTAKSGDTLRKIAGRPEIYGDPDLWPALQEANADLVGQSTRVNKGVTLKIPRDLTQEQIDMAHEKARQAAAAAKMSSPSGRRRMATPEPTVAPKEGAKAEPTPVPAQPVPKAKKSGMLLPVLFVLLLILAGLAAVLFYFMKKEKKEEHQG